LRQIFGLIFKICEKKDKAEIPANNNLTQESHENEPRLYFA